MLASVGGIIECRTTTAIQPHQIATFEKEHLKKAKKDIIIMHPGPINRGIEITDEVADGPYSVILDQVENGVAVRMAILYLLIGRSA